MWNNESVNLCLVFQRAVTSSCHTSNGTIAAMGYCYISNESEKTFWKTPIFVVLTHVVIVLRPFDQETNSFENVEVP